MEHENKYAIGFQFVDWPVSLSALPSNDSGFVYIIFIRLKDRRIPLYIGETKSIVNRVGDYEYKSFSAATDFKVGEAISFLHSCGHGIQIAFRQSECRNNEEKELVRELVVAGFHLLNSLPGYPTKPRTKTRSATWSRAFAG